MSVFRAFIAIELAPDVLRQIAQVSQNLQQKLPGVPVRWVQSENIHLTLKFLGDVSISNVQVINEIIHAAVEPTVEFEISVGGLGAYPSIRRPRVVWVGVEGPPALMNIQRMIDLECTRLGYVSEEKHFSPHLTLGRVSRNASQRDIHQISEVLAESKTGFLGATVVKQLFLFKSDLKPGGAVYSKMYSAALKKPVA